MVEPGDGGPLGAMGLSLPPSLLQFDATSVTRASRAAVPIRNFGETKLIYLRVCATRAYEVEDGPD
jgi:hypothetical protein